MNDPIPRHPQYHNSLVELMSFVDQTNYPRNTLFTPAVLGQLKPQQIEHWMQLKVYGTATPGPNDRPVHGRSTSLEYYKKAISHYMPNKLMPWNQLTQVGNPTRSIEVNKLIKKVKQAEVRKLGKESSARRPLQKTEYHAIHRILEQKNDFPRKVKVPTFVKFQFHLIARSDDTANFETDDLKGNPEFDFTLLCQMCWSKNVLEERDAPDQILIGAMDPDYCILVGLAIYLECWMEHGDGIQSKYMFSDDTDDNAPRRTKDYVRSILKRDVFDSQQFEAARQGPLGTHSIRKYPTTHARRNGCRKDECEVRGRWKNCRRIIDRYIDPELMCIDAKVAAALCVGGPCKYKLVDGSGVSNQWLAANVVPHILLRFPQDESHIAQTLALPLLWACMEPTMENNVPVALRDRVRNAYNTIRQLPEGVNPVKKALLVVYNVEEELHIEEAADQGDQQQGAAQQPTQQMLRTLVTQLNTIERRFNEFQESVRNNNGDLRTDIGRQLATLNRNIRRLYVVPAYRRAAGEQNDNNGGNGGGGAQNGGDGQGDAAVPFASTLSRTPRTLYDLWTEYEYGIGGRKPAKDFTATERGRVKYMYHRRKVVWDKVAELVRAGHTAQVAIDRIYQAYGRNQSVTTIINRMRSDRQNGGHPNLRV